VLLNMMFSYLRSRCITCRLCMYVHVLEAHKHRRLLLLDEIGAALGGPAGVRDGGRPGRLHAVVEVGVFVFLPRCSFFFVRTVDTSTPPPPFSLSSLPADPAKREEGCNYDVVVVIVSLTLKIWSRG